MKEKMTLHEAMIKLLKESRNPMTTREIATALNKNQWYERGDKIPIKANQISARANRYQKLFCVNRGVRPMTITLANN
ncbi:MAG: winged helix-turn-helix domain-containing protein [Prevotellaceae bacterium]|jgi:predicted Zn-ribbon and HTH transcriptional regulator|nr:winged helix-turn-helix domain-containing protein [Prevotellaceae bacterium]